MKKLPTGSLSELQNRSKSDGFTQAVSKDGANSHSFSVDKKFFDKGESAGNVPSMVHKGDKSSGSVSAKFSGKRGEGYASEVDKGTGYSK